MRPKPHDPFTLAREVRRAVDRLSARRVEDLWGVPVALDPGVAGGEIPMRDRDGEIVARIASPSAGEEGTG